MHTKAPVVGVVGDHIAIDGKKSEDDWNRRVGFLKSSAGAAEAAALGLKRKFFNNWFLERTEIIKA